MNVRQGFTVHTGADQALDLGEMVRKNQPLSDLVQNEIWMLILYLLNPLKLTDLLVGQTLQTKAVQPIIVHTRRALFPILVHFPKVSWFVRLNSGGIVCFSDLRCKHHKINEVLEQADAEYSIQ